MTTAVAPSTPKSQIAPNAVSTPSPGNWSHPRFDEIQRRQNANSLGDQDVRKILWNGIALALLILVGSQGFSRSSWYGLVVPQSAQGYVPYVRLSFVFLFVYNILVTLAPIMRPKDNLTDIPLTPTQRAALGLDPNAAAPPPTNTTISPYITPPRYSRSPTPRKSSSGSRSRSPAGSPGSRIESPLLKRQSADEISSMGASDSKLVFKQGIFKLSEPAKIPVDDRYWTGFWELPESTEDVFSLFSPIDIRRARDNSLANIETLVHTLTSRLFELRNHRAFPHPDNAPEKHALNCIRVLTRVIPFLYEADHLEHWKEQTFWQKRRRPLRKGNRVTKSEVLFDEGQQDEVPQPESQEQYEELRPLGEELVDTLVDLLFYTNFTLPLDERSKTRVTYSIWQSGVGCNTAMNSSSQIESNRSEVLRLLLTLSSEALYLPARALNQLARIRLLKFLRYDTDEGHEFMILVLFYAMEYKTDATKQGIVRMCVFVLQTLTTEPTLGKRLNRKFERQEELPPSIRLTEFDGTYADFLIIGKLDAIYPALLATINNVAAYLEDLSAQASTRLLHLYTTMSAPSFLLANETNHTLLQSVLDSINAVIEHQYTNNKKFIQAVFRSRKRFEALRSFTLESGQAEIERQKQRKKDLAEGAIHPSSPTRTPRNRSIDSARTPISSRSPALTDVPEEGGAFAIGDDESDDDEDREMLPTPSHSSASRHNSRTPSIASSADEPLPAQLRGMSEKARGKMPAGQPSFSRQNSMTSLSSHQANMTSPTLGFEPSASWVYYSFDIRCSVSRIC
ncbi:MAG: hypothetical protein Q9195_006526 [Heterodermia aff. obscurata]